MPCLSCEVRVHLSKSRKVLLLYNTPGCTMILPNDLHAVAQRRRNVYEDNSILAHAASLSNFPAMHLIALALGMASPHPVHRARSRLSHPDHSQPSSQLPFSSNGPSLSQGLTTTPTVFAWAMTVLHNPSKLNPLSLNSLCLIFAIS